MLMRKLTSSSSGGVCRNPSLGLMTKARACKVVGQKGSLGMKENVRVHKGLPPWELESRWTPECS
jgi:hypothetical protein